MSLSSQIRLLALTVVALAVGLFGPVTVRPEPAAQEIASAPPLHWQSSARLRHGLRKKIPGSLMIGPEGVAFLSQGQFSHRWPYLEIRTLYIAPREIILTGYENRAHRFPGDRRYRFDLESAIPPAMAAELAQRIGKPVRNADPESGPPTFPTIPARHRTRAGGSNGVLRFRDAGIDYVTQTAQDARSWRWADIQTLANPNPYQLRVSAYLETFDFELKQPMPPDLFDRLWDHVYARDLNVGQLPGGGRHAE